MVGKYEHGRLPTFFIFSYFKNRMFGSSRLFQNSVTCLHMLPTGTETSNSFYKIVKKRISRVVESTITYLFLGQTMSKNHRKYHENHELVCSNGNKIQIYLSGFWLRILPENNMVLSFLCAIYFFDLWQDNLS